MDLVVSHFNENLRWLRKVPADYQLFIYVKGEEPDLSFLERDFYYETLPNVGREAHTWLHHLNLFRDRNAPVTVFLQGYPFDHCNDAHKKLRQLHEVGGLERADGFEWWGFIVETDDPMGERVFLPWSKNTDRRLIDIGSFYEKVFEEPGPPEYRFFPGGQFVVTGEAIRRRSTAFYERVRDLSAEVVDAEYCLERFWDRIFKADPITPEEMRDEMTLYLKPMEKLRL